GRKLIVVSEASKQPMDLVRGDSAGFHDISAIDIDDKRGDLWVTTTAADDGAASLHRLQLVSGRPLRTYRVESDAAPVDLVDVAVTRGGTVVVLDAANARILTLRPGTTSLERLMRLKAHELLSVAAGGEEGIVYVA